MTSHVLDQLPLWVEGDLAPADQAAVEAHLTACPACRAEADRIQTTQAWLREALAPPFGPKDHAALQAAVLVRLAVREPAPPLPSRRPALLAGLAAALALVAVARLLSPRAPGTPERPAGAPPAAAPSPPVQPVRAPTEARAPSPPRARPQPAAPTPDAPARIEFQTADPTIRIIWLAQAKPLPDTNLPFPEAP